MFFPHLSGLGIDVSEHHVRFALVSFFGGVKHVQEIVLPEGYVVDEKIVKQEELKALIQEQLKTIRPFIASSVRTTILVPESRVFSAEILVELHQDEEMALAEATRLAQKKIPIPFGQAYLSASWGEKISDQKRVNIYTSPREVIDGLSHVFLTFFPHLIAMEVNSKALQRLLILFSKYKQLLAKKDQLICIADVGHSWSTISVFTSYGSQLFSRTLSHAGHCEVVEGKMVLRPEAAQLIAETITETKAFFHVQKRPIAVAVLCGVEAMQEHVLDACRLEKEIPVILAGDMVTLHGASKDSIHCFGAAIGAAYRALRPGQYAYQHNFLSGMHEEKTPDK
ncbi:TPA: hypothetical protein DEP34_00215 [Candidatus Uhrbacteria bacterium]|uniref:Type IV pilus assembly protein PilM n=2 Tax=Candidatus Uhriibacteriota TaxID=1752732 RepID=A0A0G1QA06_9BACT|nr:MAG: hypothetical protein UX45_C0002G0044 [Candidatus Uhrbacteria bacterium GW2011_GWF2_46_218]KKU41819.1 MAG: hypothetical protein UX57_C0001G0043 [Candidatus Uhrbacteria bacterium GW2011_GWE2_46_68]HBK34131.1 hypothetical protein [Candidatus Uhrbacteria bacterium]HCB18797.1 hypothetical protein [Candidatus Uhrbacteria bacterium]